GHHLGSPSPAGRRPHLPSGIGRCSPPAGRLVVKSNTAWVLVAHTSEPGAVVAWKITGGSIWQRLGAATPVLKGLKGVHQVEYEVQLDGRTAQPGLPITITFSVEPATAH